MEHNALNEVLILLALSVATVAVVRRVNLPPILGYLLIGVIAGHHALGWVPDTEAIHLLGEIGVVFLLFMIGLEISLPQLMAMKGTVLGLGGAQVVGSTASGALLAWWLGIPWQGAIVVGGALALSSTALVVKQMTEQLEMSSRHGRIALGILLFQDLAVVPFLVMIPIFAGQGEGSMGVAVGLALLKGIGVVVLMLWVGRKLSRPLFHWVSAAHSVELFTLTILLVALAAAWLTAALGLSLALGAFIAGMLLGDTEYRHQIETEVRPFRDVLMGLFFITVGTHLNPAVLLDIWPWVLLLVTGLVVGKGALIAVLARVGGYDWGVATRAGVVLGQGGEFGFALLSLALSVGLLTSEESQPILAAIVVSMAIAPLLIGRNGLFAKRFCTGYLKQQAKDAYEIARDAHEVEGHVVICGFGRLGQNLAGFLTEEGIDYVAVDLDPLIIKEAWDSGEKVFYGDATHRSILRGAGVQRARALVISRDNLHSARGIIDAAKRLNPDLPIVVRTRDDKHMEELERLGASIVIPETVETSLTLAGRLMEILEVDAEEIRSLIRRARDDHYQRLRGYFHGDDLSEMELDSIEDHHRLHTVVISADTYADGLTLGELDLETRCDVVVQSVRHAGVLGANPAANFRLQVGDALVLRGSADELERAEVRLLTGAV